MGNSISIIRAKRGQLNKQGKAALDAFVESCLKLDLTHEERAMVLSLKMTELLREYPMPPIRLIKFEDFVGLKTFPRYPDNKDLCVDLDKIDRNNSFLVFISHCWLRGYSGAEGWDGRPHPDNASGDKYELCVEGIKQLRKDYACRVSDCYVWLDFGCINQDGNPAGELEQLDKIVQCCDCIFTPIVDKEHASWDYPSNLTKVYHDYQAKLWMDGPHAYLNRGWCRVEMLYAANIPVQENTPFSDGKTVERHTMFGCGLAFQCRQKRRPHYLYGTKEYTGHLVPWLLPPLQYSFLSEYHPLQGCLSVASDVDHIRSLMMDLQPFIDANNLPLGYSGSKNGQGVFDYGTMRYTDGSVYQGGWLDGFRHDYGFFTSSNGDVYAGDWMNDMKHGKGTYWFADGAVYEGHWMRDLCHGQGRLISAEGSEYKGDWEMNMKHGHGKLDYADGNVYVGEWKHNMKDGQGEFCFGVDGVYEGTWMKDMRHGYGKMIFKDDSVYDGEWMNDTMHGKGVYRYVDGTVREGTWSMGSLNNSIMS